MLESIEKVFAWNIREFREKKQLTQEMVSEKAKIPLRTYQTMEKGRIPKKKANLVRLAAFYGVESTCFFVDPDLQHTNRVGSDSSALFRVILALLATLDDSELRDAHDALIALFPSSTGIRKAQ